MASEDIPLLVSDGELAHEALYNRFSTSRKRVIVALVGCSGFCPVCAWIVYPLHSAIAADLNSTGQIVSFTVSVLTCGVALGSMLFATYSGFYGRRPTYLCCLPLHCLGSIGVGTAKTIPQLMIFRFVQGFGTSGGMAVGGAVIGDIYKLTERGTAMGIFFAASLLGAKYSSWRDVQLGLFLSAYLFSWNALTLARDVASWDVGMDESEDSESTAVGDRRYKWVWLNPFSCIWLLRSPKSPLRGMCCSTIASATVLYTDNRRTVQHTNEAIIGACYFPMGLGNIIGAPLAGMLSDRIVIKWRKRRGGDWIQEDRLRVAVFGGATLVPLSIVLCGFITHFVSGPLGLSLNLFCFFINGLGVYLVLSPSSAYLVDVVHSQSSQIWLPASDCVFLLLAIAVSSILPSISHFGVLVTNTAVGIIAWGGFILLWLTVKYGDKMRAWVDVGYSTIETT
ncbi:MFS general substrate transporter [Mycena olivaceomarginata]|nr:MFS general substrate transporter [Mycena olivaceomarginata]